MFKCHACSGTYEDAAKQLFAVADNYKKISETGFITPCEAANSAREEIKKALSLVSNDLKEKVRSSEYYIKIIESFEV